MNSTKIDPKFIGKSNPRVGLIALASDFTIEKDFINVIKDKKIDLNDQDLKDLLVTLSKNKIAVDNPNYSTFKKLIK